MAGNLDVSDAMAGLTETETFALIGKTADDFEVKETIKDAAPFEVVREPLPAKELQVKPEGQRTWKWWNIWTEQVLELDDMVRDAQGTVYRVMTAQLWGAMGNYNQYHVVEWPE